MSLLIDEPLGFSKLSYAEGTMLFLVLLFLLSWLPSLVGLGAKVGIDRVASGLTLGRESICVWMIRALVRQAPTHT
jgi:hypothetical protein